MAVPTQNILTDRVQELENIVYGAPVIGGSPALGVRGTGATALTGSTDALLFPLPDNTYYVQTAGVDAMTLALPVAGSLANGGDDTKRIRVVDAGGHAHTITGPSGSLVPAHHLLTFGGTAGSAVTLEAFGGVWYVAASSGVTAS